jgi:DNA polymerase-3 subunit alpha
VRGLGVRLQLARTVDEPVDGCSGAEVVLALGEEARFYPTDAALASWRAQSDQGRAVIAYE